MGGVPSTRHAVAAALARTGHVAAKISSQLAAQLSEHVQCVKVLCRYLAQLGSVPDPSSKTTPSPASRPLPPPVLGPHFSHPSRAPTGTHPSRLAFAPSPTPTS